MKGVFGKILKGIGGFYYVKTDNEIIECKACGKFRKNSCMPYVGDNVILDILDDNKGYITSICDRKNLFIRPPVVNIDALVIVAALCNPHPDIFFIDKLATIASSNNVEVSICFNKDDLAQNIETERYKKIYADSGYNIYITSALNDEGIDQMRAQLEHKVVAFSGFSGVGKSSIINRIIGYDKFEVGEVSKKLNRGKHTTRHVEIIEYRKDSFIVDTPGFSMLTLPDLIDKNSLKTYFHEFDSHALNCKFSDCLHLSDKCCGVYDAVKDGMIPEERYLSYTNMYEGLKQKKEWHK